MKNLSIIIPHYNSITLLKKLLTSIPPKKDIEVIVVDDNSTEDIKELKELMRNPEFNHVLFLENNTGIQSAGACRNVGLECANGNWLLFADADDYFVEDFYETIKKYFYLNKDVIFFSPTSVYIDTNELADRHIKFDNLIKDYQKKQSIKNETKLRYEYVVPWSKMIKASLIKDNNIKFDEVIAMNDIMFSTKVGFYMETFITTDEVIYCVTRNKGSLTMMMSKEVHDSRVNALLRYYTFINKKVKKKSIKHLNISSVSAVVRAYKAKLGMKEVISTYKIFRRNKIRLLDKRFLNPKYVINKTLTRVLFNKKEKRYYKS